MDASLGVGCASKIRVFCRRTAIRRVGGYVRRNRLTLRRTLRRRSAGAADVQLDRGRIGCSPGAWPRRPFRAIGMTPVISDSTSMRARGEQRRADPKRCRRKRNDPTTRNSRAMMVVERRRERLLQGADLHHGAAGGRCAAAPTGTMPRRRPPRRSTSGAPPSGQFGHGRLLGSPGSSTASARAAAAARAARPRVAHHHPRRRRARAPRWPPAGRWCRRPAHRHHLAGDAVRRAARHGTPPPAAPATRPPRSSGRSPSR